jgi:hypothetical protein
VTILRSFTADDGQKYVALQWLSQDDCCIEETEQHAGVFNVSLYNPLLPWDSYVKTMWTANPFNEQYLDNLDPNDDNFQGIGWGDETQFYEDDLDYNPVTDQYRVEIDGTEYVFTEQSSMNKDLEKMGSMIEKRSSQNLAAELVARYGFSEERSQKVAKTFSSFKKIQKKRNLTDKDLNSFSETLLGSSYSTVKKAVTSLTEGNESAFETLVEKASSHNDVSPEGMKAVLSSMILNN